MGIHDRDYYRDETSGSNWLYGTAPAVKMIIFINVGIFLVQWITQDVELNRYFALRSSDIFERFQIWRLLTATFLHSQGNIFHVVWNMYFLWMVGREMESMYGSREFTLLYLTGAVFSSLCWALVDYYGPNHNPLIPMIGASGAVTAVVLLFTLYYPHHKILVMFIIPMEMWLVLVIFLGSDLLWLIRDLQGGPVAAGVPAVASHLGGALYGFLYKTYDLRWSRLLSARRHRPRMRIVSPPEPRDRVPTPPPASARSAAAGAPRHAPTLYFPEEQLDAKVDEILAKIAREGRDGLTEDEIRVLEEASRRARNRRSDRV